MKSFFDEVPREISEAAIVDGCTQFGAFRKSVLPLVKGGLATTALFVFILNWSDFLIALVLAGNNDRHRARLPESDQLRPRPVRSSAPGRRSA